MEKENIYIDLSKCSEEQRKSIPQILKKANEDIYEMTENMLNSGGLIDEDGDDNYILLSKSLENEWIAYLKSGCDEKTELTYPEFIKLFEDGEGENNGWIKIESEADLPKENGVYWTYTVDNNMQLRPKEDFIFNGKFNKYFTHYQPIVKPEPPKF